MQAVRVNRCGEPEVLTLETLPDPEPSEGEVLVRVRAAGVNPVDTYLRSGAQGYAPKLPYTPGFDAAGEVAAVGAGVEGVRPGDRVYCAGTLSGACASMALCSAEQVHPLPDGIDFEQGACIGIPYVTAHRALFDRARATEGERVLIHGASGGVGTAAIQLAVAHGLRAAGTAGTEAGRQLAREQGAEAVFDHHAPGHIEEARRHFGEADIILEMLANANLGADLGLLAYGGRVVVIGSRGPAAINPRDLMARDAAILGVIVLRTPPEARAAIHAALHSGLSSGALKPVVGKRFGLSEAAAAHHWIIEQPAHGNVVLIP